MKSQLSVITHTNPLVSVVQSPSYCTRNGETYFSSNSYFSFSNGLSYSVGYPLLCINNTYTPYCSSITNQLVADYYCSSYDSKNIITHTKHTLHTHILNTHYTPHILNTHSHTKHTLHTHAQL